jgi:hypothetical protein
MTDPDYLARLVNQRLYGHLERRVMHGRRADARSRQTPLPLEPPRCRRSRHGTQRERGRNLPLSELRAHVHHVSEAAMTPRELEPGDVVQISPETFGNKAFAGCMAIVTEPKSFGCQGYVQMVGETREQHGGQTFIRLNWDDIEFVGHAVWVWCE